MPVYLRESSKIFFRRLVQDSKLPDYQGSLAHKTNNLVVENGPQPQGNVSEKEIFWMVGVILAAVLCPLLLGGLVFAFYSRKRKIPLSSAKSSTDRFVNQEVLKGNISTKGISCHLIALSLDSVSTAANPTHQRKNSDSKFFKSSSARATPVDRDSILSSPTVYSQEKLLCKLSENKSSNPSDIYNNHNLTNKLQKAADLSKSKSPTIRRNFKSEENLLNRNLLKKKMTTAATTGKERTVKYGRRQRSLDSLMIFEGALDRRSLNPKQKEEEEEGPLDWYARHATPDSLKQDLSFMVVNKRSQSVNQRMIRIQRPDSR